MRDIVPRKREKKDKEFSFSKPSKKVLKKEENEPKITATIVKGKKNKRSKALIVFVIFVIFLGLAAASYYFLYINKDVFNVKNQDNNSLDNEVAEFEKMIQELEGSVGAIDQSDKELESPTIDLNINF